MKRKLIKQGGGGGLTLYVPRAWIKEQGLKPGDEVEFTQVEHSLLLSSEAKVEVKETTITITHENQSFIHANISSLYRLGYDKIKVIYNTKEQYSTIKDCVENFLLGFEITDKKEDYILLETVSEPSGEKQHILLRRMFFLIKESLTVLHEDLANGKLKNFEVINKNGQKMGQYTHFCIRNIMRKKFLEERSSYYSELYQNLAKIHTSILHLYKIACKDPRKTKYLNILELIQKNFNNIHEGFYSKDFESLVKANKSLVNLLYNKVHEGLKKEKGMESINLYYFGEISRLMNFTAVPILGILLR